MKNFTILAALILALGITTGCGAEDPEASPSENQLCPQGANSCDGNSDGNGDSEVPEGLLQFEPEEVVVMTREESQGQSWYLEAIHEDRILTILLDPAYDGPSAPGLFEIGSSETNYATCGICIRLETGCVPEGRAFRCEKSFMPAPQGTLTLTSMGHSTGQSFAGALEDILFNEVNIHPDTFATTVISGGEEYLLDTFSFNEEVLNLTPPVVCGGHGHRHGNHCHCDPGYRVDPQDPLNCIPG